MKKILLVAGLISGISFAQIQFENPGFENWENVGTPTEEPLEWSSLKTATGPAWGAAVVCSRSTDAHSGSYSVRLENKSSFGVVNNGLLTNGRVAASFTPADGYVFTDAGSTQWNLACADRPDSLVGWFKYDPEGNDTAEFEVILHTNAAEGKLPETTTPAPHWIGRAVYRVGTTTTVWTRFSVPFEYYSTGTPNYILTVLSSGDGLDAIELSVLYLDDLELIYNPPNTVTIAPVADQFINTGIDGSVLTATEAPSAAVSREWKYSTTSGSGYVSFGAAETGLTYTPNFATAGNYYVVCESNFGTESITSNEVAIYVSDAGTNTVVISPSSTQTILLGEDGTLMTATETPGAADSREWKYSTTSGSGYGSFAVAETGTTFTPNFAVLGTYYLICESDFAGDIKMSNEVTIVVPSAAGINNDDLNFQIQNKNGQLHVQCSIIENTHLSLYGLNGQLVYSTELTEEITTHELSGLQGIYVYSVTYNGTLITGKIQF